ncbi:HAD-IIB family hydrolase [Alienimonas chondri]|uniref:Mannosylfructose-phosphate phosphatase n=1 Tax=Alienimonas chondri TaxID=2681879 RepID=A0ABX1VFI1_9PLAN|nr:HAD-IIB family hydrolase [Alienimonas chondri]NNJ26494.1 Mannosylfructose-phosphate phosphatase [Alienimonas chondri]
MSGDSIASPAASPRFEWLLISDVDGTLLGPKYADAASPDAAALHNFAAFYEERRERAELGLVLSSGRFAASVLESVAATDLPTPDAVIGGVGTEIFIRDHLGEFPEPLADWPATFENWDAEAVRYALATVPRLIVQPEEFQSDYKASYYFRRATEADLAGIARRLEDAGVAARVVYSSSRDLDVLPVAADKGNAAAFLSKWFGVPPERTIVSGDSGNDAAMFRDAFRGVVVGNALPELKNFEHPHLYQAEGVAAAGVIEGIRYWTDRPA